jgi:hypothetical protein
MACKVLSKGMVLMNNRLSAIKEACVRLGKMVMDIVRNWNFTWPMRWGSMHPIRGSGGAGFEGISGSWYSVVLSQSFQWYFIIFPCVPQIVPNSIKFYP